MQVNTIADKINVLDIDIKITIATVNYISRQLGSLYLRVRYFIAAANIINLI